MKKIIYIAIGVVLIAVLSIIFMGEKNNTAVESDADLTDAYILELTYEYSKEYLDLRIRTDNVLLNAADFGSYEEWDDEMTRLGFLWQQMAEHADFLEEKADEYSKLTPTSDATSFLRAPTAHAYTKSAITNIYDSAPAGQGIKKLASYLGVDARRALEILRGDQEQMKADAFIEGGKELRDLENSAVVIKDGCKVAGFVGGVILSGGAAGVAASGVVAQGTLVVTGADMVLEITDDAANIAMGDANKVSAIVGTARSFTEPVASILSLNDVAKNLAANAPKAGEKLMNTANAVMFNADQIRSIVQDEKVLGISFADSPENEKARQAFAASLTEHELRQWIKDNTIKERTVADSLDDLAVEIQDRTVLDSLDDLEDELEYKEFVKDYVAEQERELEAERKRLQEEADARIKEAEAELRQEEASFEEKQQDSWDTYESETELLDRNYDEYIEINKTYPSMDEIFKMTEAERAAADAEKKAKQDARKERLKAGCESLYGPGEEAEMCYVRGAF